MNGLGITLSSKIGGVSDLALFPLLRRERRMIRNITYVETLRNKTAPTTPPAMAPAFVLLPLLELALPEEVMADVLDLVGVGPVLVELEGAVDSGTSIEASIRSYIFR